MNEILCRVQALVKLTADFSPAKSLTACRSEKLFQSTVGCIRSQFFLQTLAFYMKYTYIFSCLIFKFLPVWRNFNIQHSVSDDPFKFVAQPCRCYKSDSRFCVCIRKEKVFLFRDALSKRFGSLNGLNTNPSSSPPKPRFLHRQNTDGHTLQGRGFSFSEATPILNEASVDFTAETAAASAEYKTKRKTGILHVF